MPQSVGIQAAREGCSIPRESGQGCPRAGCRAWYACTPGKRRRTRQLSIVNSKQSFQRLLFFPPFFPVTTLTPAPSPPAPRRTLSRTLSDCCDSAPPIPPLFFDGRLSPFCLLLPPLFIAFSPVALRSKRPMDWWGQCVGVRGGGGEQSRAEQDSRKQRGAPPAATPLSAHAAAHTHGRRPLRPLENVFRCSSLSMPRPGRLSDVCRDESRDVGSTKGDLALSLAPLLLWVGGVGRVRVE